MRKFRFSIFIAIVIAIFAWPVPKAQAAMTRGIYVNGQVHYFTVGGNSNSQTISHQSGTVDSSTNLLNLGTAVTQSVGSCTPDYGGIGMNGAVFENKIFFAYTGNPGCNLKPATGDTHLYVIAWDLTTGDFVRVGGAGSAYAGPTDLGSVYHTDTNNVSLLNGNEIDMAGAAIVVFNNLIYVFADNGTYTSGDGVNWSAYPALPVGGNNMEPLDAITFYPPDADPLIMIIYGNFPPGSFGYEAYNNLGPVYATTWNGQLGSASILSGQNISSAISGKNYTGSTLVNRCMGLFVGTATPEFTAQSSNNPPGFSPGATAPSLQLFLGQTAFANKNGQAQSAFRRVEYSYNTDGGQWTVDPALFIPIPNNAGSVACVFPWFETEDANGLPILRQYLVVNAPYGSNNATQGFPFMSDAMVPKNTEIPPTLTNPGGMATDTGAGASAAQIATYQKYWTLVGVVMGSPPFALNEAQDFEIANLSNVTYGQNQTAEVSNSQVTDSNLLVSAGASVQAGLSDVIGLKYQVDLSYKHGWESVNGTSSTSTVSYGLTFGTENAATNPNDAASIGMYGWAIFHIPTIVVQDYALYAYDYDTATNIGTYLNQDITTTQVNTGDLSYRQVAFELANPGGPNDTIPGLMSGMTPLTKSTDFTGWQQGWESNSTDSATTYYTTLLGDGTAGETKINTITFVPNSNGSVSYSQDKQTVTTTGQSNDIEVSSQDELTVDTGLLGFAANLKAGYSGNFSNSETTTTTLGSDVEAALGMPNCSDSGCINSLTVQPYWLNATASGAPWVPTAYNSQLPWALQWRIVNYSTNGGGQAGVSPTPDQGSGIVVGGLGGTPEGPKASSGNGSYSLLGGNMVWRMPDGELKPIPMTASEFKPALGVSVDLNGFAWSSSKADGTWTRQGNVWTFNTKKSVRSDIMVLKLDFERQIWEFNLSKSDLSPFFSASGGRTHLALSVNGKYKFYCDYDHEVKSQWDLKTSAKASDELSLSSYNGSFDSSTDTGTVVLEGDLPAGLKHFGDMSFSVNGRQLNVPLISNENYAHALATGGNLVYQKGNITVSVDFGKKTWRASFSGKIDPHFEPIGGAAAIQVKVGGAPWCTGKHAILNFASTLNYTNPGLGGAGPRSF
jgi:hypothetical protein